MVRTSIRVTAPVHGAVFTADDAEASLVDVSHLSEPMQPRVVNVSPDGWQLVRGGRLRYMHVGVPT